MSSAPEAAQFWLPPPPQTASLQSIRAALPAFPSPPLRVSRVGQLDGALLDQELEGILAAPVWKALEGLRSPGRRSWEPEMLAALRIAILKMSLWERGATYGSSLQNLKYRNEHKHQDGFQSTATDSSLTRVQKTAYMILEVLPFYLHARLRDRMLSAAWSDEALPRSWLSLIDLRRLSKRQRRATDEEDGQWRGEWKRVVWELLSIGERLAAIAGLANFLVFLYDGRYRTLVDRILGMRLVYAERSVSRNVSFEFLNRQLVWEAFTEFLLFLMPLVNVHRLRLKASRLLLGSKSKTLATIVAALPAPIARALRLPINRAPPHAAADPALATTRPLTRPEGPFHFLPSTTCPVCYSLSAAPPTDLPSSDPTSSAALAASARSAGGADDSTVKVPYVADCGWECRYCYYCVVGRLVAAEEEGEESWSCMRCGGEVHGVSREVLEAPESPPGIDVVKVDTGDGDDDDDGEIVERAESVSSEHDRWRK